MDIVQEFYGNLAQQYDRLFSDWDASVKEQAEIIRRMICENGFGTEIQILDCACGIGTQAIGLAALGYDVTASDISDAEIAEARQRAEHRGVRLRFAHADFRTLAETFGTQFDLVIAMDNALPHMLTRSDLEKAVRSIAGRLKPSGMFLASIRDYDSLLKSKPPYSAPYIHKTAEGQRVSFQTWDWDGDCYCLTQYIIEDSGTPEISKFTCAYRAVRRAELSELLQAAGFRTVRWLMPDETGYYQPVVAAMRGTASQKGDRIS